VDRVLGAVLDLRIFYIIGFIPGLRKAFIQSRSCISKSVSGIVIYDGFAKSLTVIIVAHKYLLSAAIITNNFFSFRLTKMIFSKTRI